MLRYLQFNFRSCFNIKFQWKYFLKLRISPKWELLQPDWCWGTCLHIYCFHCCGPFSQESKFAYSKISSSLHKLIISLTSYSRLVSWYWWAQMSWPFSYYWHWWQVHDIQMHLFSTRHTEATHVIDLWLCLHIVAVDCPWQAGRADSCIKYRI